MPADIMNDETPTMNRLPFEYCERRINDAFARPITEADFRSSPMLRTSDLGDGYAVHRAVRKGRLVTISQAPADVITAMLATAGQS